MKSCTSLEVVSSAMFEQFCSVLCDYFFIVGIATCIYIYFWINHAYVLDFVVLQVTCNYYNS